MERILEQCVSIEDLITIYENEGSCLQIKKEKGNSIKEYYKIFGPLGIERVPILGTTIMELENIIMGNYISIESMQSYDGEVVLRTENPRLFRSRRQTIFYKNKGLNQDNDNETTYNAYKKFRTLPISLDPVKVLFSKGIVGIKDGKLIFLDSTASKENMEQIKNTNNPSTSSDLEKSSMELRKEIDKEIVQKTKNTSWWGTAKKLAPWAIAAGITFVGYKGLQQLKQKQK